MTRSTGILRENFEGLMSKDWLDELESVLCSPEMAKTYAVIRQAKAKGISVYPSLDKCFRAFQLPMTQVRVVVIGQDPYHNGSATGLAFANPDIPGKPIQPSLKTIFDEIEQSVYGGVMLNKDPTLENWAKQGILLLNTALTVEKGRPESHLDLWELFTYRVFAVLREWKPGTIYVLWGTKARKFLPCIDAGRNYILTAAHPATHAYGGTGFLGCNHFNKINEIIEKNNGVDFCIQW